ncbi:signal peptidase II [Clostridium oryzae]|uniref:Lipoprotein signal peptidase n=1 Tax=Clostridium oryzae TaxID=1450648 RepID=A0A1V4IT80_9CLOT|nr:signal peptidase II [Clostridium oryzae]OPJ63228.1 lipoprotein signal peptidase [Clostridium oryzae]
MEYLIIVLGIILDRIAKIWAAANLKNKPDIVVIKNFFSFSYVENRGAAFGILQNKQIILSIVTLAVIVAIFVYMVMNRKKSKLLSISLSLIISGAVGNLIDRVFYSYVVDFIMLHYKSAVWPNFNVADSFVVVGTILLVIYVIRDVK